MTIRVFGLEASKRKKLKDRVKRFAKKENLERDLNIIFVDADYIRRLNNQFLRRNYVTDVLSFDLDEVCEIYVHSEIADDFEENWKLVLHGLLHLQGYNHQTKPQEMEMERKAEKYRKC